MNPDLLSANVSIAFAAIMAVALLIHLSQIFGSRRYSHLVQAAVAAGVLYFLGINAFGWRFIPREALMGLFAGLFALVAAVAIVRRVQVGSAGFSWSALLMELGAAAYIFAPATLWKPPVSALLAILFLFELLQSIKGSEAVAQEEVAGKRPPLLPPKRVRGPREFAAMAAALAFVYVFAMGTGKAPLAPQAENAPETQAPDETQVAAETPTPPEPHQSAEEAPKEASETPPAPKASEPAPETQGASKTYTAAAGETLKSIARKLYGKPEKWRALAAANPGVKPGGKLKAGQVLTLPAPPVK